MPSADFMILLAVPLPPIALQTLGEFVEEQTMNTPYGEVGPLALRRPAEGPAVWLAPYTGLPDRTDPRATIFAARELGVRRVLGWELGVGINPLLEPGALAIAGDYIDWTRHQPSTFVERRRTDFDADALALRPVFCPQMTAALAEVVPGAAGCIYLAVDGPRRETGAEAHLYRQWGVDVLGQNLVPEVALAQELGLCFAGLITIGAVAADRIQPPHHGEIRASLHATLDALPACLRLLAGPTMCDCAA